MGSLAEVPAPRLGAVAVREAVARAGVDPAGIADVVMGNVLQAGLGQAPARQAALAAGLPPSTRAVTVHKVCGSGLQAVLEAALLIRSGMAATVVAGGMENMSRAPYLLANARAGLRLGDHGLTDSLVHDGLRDPYHGLHMGSCAERCVERYGFSREQQDDYAARSFERALAAQAAGEFDAEIVPVTTDEGTVLLDRDEGTSRVNFDKMPQLRPAFEAGGTITAANASTINDGAAALVLAGSGGDTGAGRPLARIVSFGAHAQDPLWFTTAPIMAARLALSAAGWSVADVDLWEVNEAFAVVPLVFMAELGVAHDRVNVRGGAIALGHPIGCSGARIVVTLLAALAARQLRRGVAVICIGGGEALAVCVERM
jgi:acetyl-CoA C-acetyltransferase